MEPVIDQSLGDVVNGDACCPRDTAQVDDAFVRDPAAGARVQDGEVLVEPRCYVVRRDDGALRGAAQAASQSPSAIGQILTYGLARIQGAKRRDDVEKAMEESLMGIVPRLEKRTHYLATFANLATLLGLLGTVMGLIQAFSAVAEVNPAEKANLLSASISEAMNCTAFGLMTAVPLLIIHAVIQTKTTEVVDSLEMASVKFLNSIVERRAEGAPATA